MKYRYDHKKMMNRHGIFRCEECLGDGYLNTSRHPYGEFYTDCPKCKGTGWRQEEGFGMECKLTARRRERVAV